MTYHRPRLDRQKVEVTWPKGNLSAMSSTVAVRPLDRRTKIARRIEETKLQIYRDLGGEQYLTELQKILAEQAASLEVLISDEIVKYHKNGEVSGFYLPALNTLNRLSNTLGLKRSEKNVNGALDLDSYMSRFSRSEEDRDHA